MTMEQVSELDLDLCLICCSKIKSDSSDLPDNNNGPLLSRNLNVFYLLRKVFKVTGIQLKYTLVNCGNPVGWIKLCDKCGELTRHAEKLYRNLRRIERELKCVEKLIWDKTASSIKSEVDRKLVKETFDLTKHSGQVWRRLRNHVANKCNSSKSCEASESESFTNPFSEGDKLANYLISQNVFTAIIPNEHSNVENEEDGHVNILEETIEPKATSSSPSSPLKIKMEPQLPEILDQQENYENLLIDSLLEEFKEEMVESNDQDDWNRNLDGEDKLDWNREPDVQMVDEGSSEVEEEDDYDNLEENNSLTIDNEEDLKEEGPETGTYRPRTSSASSPKKEKVNRLPKVKEKGPLSSSLAQERRSSKYLKRGRKPTVLRTEDGKFKCRHCDQTFARPTGLNGHEREKHSKTPGAFVCDLCPRAFNSRDYLRKHIKRHHELKEDGTPKKEKAPPKIVRTPDGKYQCVHCDQIFQSSSGCTSHQRDKHSETPGAFICDLCGRAFNSHDFLRSHKAISHKVRPDGTPIPRKPPKLEKDNMCEQCGKGFKTAIQLRKHIRFVHEKRFNVTCALCGLGCRNKYSLKKHQLAMHPEDPATKKLIEEEGLSLWKCPVIGCKMKF